MSRTWHEIEVLGEIAETKAIEEENERLRSIIRKAIEYLSKIWPEDDVLIQELREGLKLK